MLIIRVAQFTYYNMWEFEIIRNDVSVSEHFDICYEVTKNVKFSALKYF